MGGLAALGGSYLLSACGGGGGSDEGTSAAANAATAKATANSSAASASGTTIPPASSITDNTGATWTLSGGVAYKNGVDAGNNYNTTLVLYYAGTIYTKGTGGQFFSWNGSNWTACNDPRLGGVSADGTSIPTSAYIIDKNNAIWTVVGGVIYKNGATVGNTYNVSTLLWYGGKLWHCGTGGQWYVNCNIYSFWLPCSDPRIAKAATAGSFFGMNGHYDYAYTPAQLVSIMKQMGCTSYRVGCTDDAHQLWAVSQIAQAFQSAGLTLFVLINQGVTDSSGNLMASESAAYTRGHACAATVASTLAPYGVTMYECGNELTRQNATVMNFSYAGDQASDFNNTNWPVMRGVMRGMIDGVKSVQSNAKCGINFCVADVGASDALWEGMQPDGTSGHPTVRWDITTWHNYEVYGDIFDIGTDGAGPGFDLVTYCKARYGVPFIISEWNTGPEQTETYRSTYITSRLTEFYANRKTHDLQSVMYYVLDSGNTEYGIMVNGVPNNPSYNSFVAFTKANADN
jgi:hypothetical protein